MAAYISDKRSLPTLISLIDKRAIALLNSTTLRLKGVMSRKATVVARSLYAMSLMSGEAAFIIGIRRQGFLLSLFYHPDRFQMSNCRVYQHVFWYYTRSTYSNYLPPLWNSFDLWLQVFLSRRTYTAINASSGSWFMSPPHVLFSLLNPLEFWKYVVSWTSGIVVCLVTFRLLPPLFYSFGQFITLTGIKSVQCKFTALISTGIVACSLDAPAGLLTIQQLELKQT